MAADLTRAVAAHRSLVAWLREAYPEADNETIAQTAEGESSLDLAIASVLREAVDTDAMARALGELIKQSQERKRRLEARADKLRAIALQAAEDAGLSKIAGPHIPDLTAVVMRSNGTAVIPDETIVPDRYVEIKRIPLKGKIGDALRDGEKFAWASLSNGHSYWMVKRS